MADIRATVSADTTAFGAAMGAAAGHVDKFAARFSNLPSKARPGLRALNTSIQGIAPTLNKVGTSVALVGAAFTAATVKMTIEAGKWADQIEDMSTALGMNQTQTQAWMRVTNKVDMTLDNFRMGVTALTDKLADAAAGNTDAQAAFERLGLRWQDLKRMDPSNMLATVVTELNKIGDSQQKLALAGDLGLGGRTAKLLAIKDPLAALNREMKSGTFITEEQTENLKALSAQLDDLGDNASAVWKKAFAEAAPILIDFIGHVNRVLEWIGKLIDAHPKLAAGFGVAFFALGPLLTGFGMAVRTIAPLVQLITHLNGLMGGMSAAGQAAAGGVGVLGKAAGAASTGGLTSLVGTLGTLAAGATVAALAIGAFVVAMETVKMAAEAAAETAAMEANQESFNSNVINAPENSRRWTPGGREQLAAPESRRSMPIWTTPGLFQWARGQAETQAWAEESALPHLRPPNPGGWYGQGGGGGAPVTVNVNVSANTQALERRLQREGLQAGRRLAAQAVG